jgi:hypothetical protein
VATEFEELELDEDDPSLCSLSLDFEEEVLVLSTFFSGVEVDLAAACSTFAAFESPILTTPPATRPSPITSIARTVHTTAKIGTVELFCVGGA